MPSVTNGAHPELTTYVGTLRVIVNSPDEVEASITMDRLKEACEALLDEEDGDEVQLTQVTSNSTDLEPTETLNVLKRARNALIRTRIKQCYDQARELDKLIYVLATKDGDLANYDYGGLLDIAQDILQKGHDPI